MAKMKVTLQADLKLGSFYWVTTVEAATEEEATIAAENKFMAQMDRGEEWEFTDFEVESA